MQTLELLLTNVVSLEPQCELIVLLYSVMDTMA